MKKLLELLRHNLIYKLISLGLALLVYVFVVNISNPVVTSTVSIELEVKNPSVLLDASQAYDIDVDSVRVSYSARSNYQRLIKARHFSAYIDLYDYSITGAVPIYVDVDESVSALISDISVSPLVAHITTEDIIEKSIKTSYELTGKLSEGRELENVTLSKDSVTVRGKESIVSGIDLALIKIDAGGRSESFSGEGPLILLDSKGREIDASDLSIDTPNLDYDATVFSFKSVAVTASVSGSPEEGYEMSGINVSPDHIIIKGESSLLKNCSSLEIPPELIDIGGAISNKSFSVDLSPFVPEGLVIDGDETVNVRVFITHSPQPEETIPSTEETLAPTEEIDTLPEETLAPPPENNQDFLHQEETPPPPQPSDETGEDVPEESETNPEESFDFEESPQ